MSDLVARLRGIVRPGPPRAPGRELTYEPERPSEVIIDPERVATVLGGEPVGEGRHACVLVRRRYEADRRHGDVTIADCCCERVDLLRSLDPSLESCSTPLLFFDLETTGLSGGAGTLAFLVGCAWFDVGALQVEQYLLTTYAAERALLSHFAGRVDASGMLVSYNGRTFDAPLLDMRWQFHRARGPLGSRPHADMLHPARRLWRARATDPDGGCRLSTLEQVLFGVERIDDVPGFEIPSRYFRFLRSGDARPLEPVMEHNRMDLVSLAAVTARALSLVEGGSAACRDGWERLALGRMLERDGNPERAMECFEDAARDEACDVRVEALARIAARHRRARRHAEAAEAWQEVLALTDANSDWNARGRVLARDAAEALAIHQEHRARNLQAARELARAALRLERTPHGTSALRYRLQRIQRKMMGEQCRVPNAGCRKDQGRTDRMEGRLPDFE
ncbi:MAG TPA: ribonuclease H-like domain-containing protein [Vicinamibacterales bacterium]|nr:ribonuclease H-like domain-containing protein [Vicinamibacterales bacterium]